MTAPAGARWCFTRAAGWRSPASPTTPAPTWPPSLAPATRRAYATDWRLFGEWCAERGLEPLRAAPATLITDSLVHRPPSFKPARDATRLYAPACA
jgi:hypothetical protein